MRDEETEELVARLMEGARDPFVPDPLTIAIAAHRKVLPEAYKGVGLTEREELAMAHALAAVREAEPRITASDAEILLDAFGSTSDEIDYVRTKLRAIADGVREAEGELTAEEARLLVEGPDAPEFEWSAYRAAWAKVRAIAAREQ